MTWPARAIDPSLISAVKSDSKLLDELLFGEPPTLFTEKPKNDGRIDLGADKALLEELSRSASLSSGCSDCSAREPFM